MGGLLEYDRLLPRGEELEVGAVGFCGKRREITARDERRRRARARERARARARAALPYFPAPAYMHACSLSSQALVLFISTRGALAATHSTAHMAV